MKDLLEEEKDFLIKRLLYNIENERILPALYLAFTHAKQRNKDAAISFKKILSDTKLTRRIGFLDTIKNNPETATEYYDNDKDNDPYAYDEETEKQLVKIKESLLRYAAQALKEAEGATIEELIESIDKMVNE